MTKEAHWKPMRRHPNVYEYQLKYGKRYGVRFTYYDGEHKRHEYKKSGFQDWKEAEVTLHKFQNQLDNGFANTLNNHKMTVNQYYEKIKKRSVEIGKWRPATVAQKDTYFKVHIKPVFGNMPLIDITRERYQHFIDEKVKSGLAKTTINTMNSVMQVIMNTADRNDVIVKNRLKNISIEGAKEPKPAKLEPQDYQKFMETARDYLSKYWYTLICLLALGARREEVVGLRYKSLKFFKQNDQEICEITYDLARTKYEQTGGKLKNFSSYRTNYVTGEFVNLLKFTLQYSKNICTQVGRQFDDDSFLFIREDNAQPIHPEYPNKILNQVERACGIHIYPHLLRHYFATMARSNNYSPTDIMHWLGHSSLEMTDSYTRPTAQGALKLINEMNPTLFGNNESKNKK
ncbi:integrase family protein [Lentilactobacillus rapi DSM 19907 = JCM 15042]|uniref:Prophage P1 protein 1, integrase n=4 Tax=Lactobacillaceae TaxID=33958 RepID=A0A512PLC9_9LACO|nr:site-specific integrase [Lentilactobacillus rapi]KRL17666.1 integrase family protein [Lentilactobacillus rapi DSM 19907 = JCM 15042]GEP71973.1 prophage P1 protein 1, integrase [Lentilactobacillus rapi]